MVANQVMVMAACLGALLGGPEMALASEPHFGAFLGYSSGIEMLEIVQSQGFKGELYAVDSLQKGYLLPVYHLINPLANQSKLMKYPVLILHGLLSDSSQMISNSKLARPRSPNLDGKVVAMPGDESIAFMLGNNNFDVWLMDARGANADPHNLNQDLKVTRHDYWKFSLDEQALYDLPAVVNFVLEQTQSEKLIYIGYSESTFFAFAQLSANPDFADKLAAFVALAPVAYVTHIQGTALNLFAPSLLVPDEATSTNTMPEPILDSMVHVARLFCSSFNASRRLCGALTNLAGGHGSTEYSAKFFATAAKRTSLRAVKHFMQLFVGQRFGAYDYGPVENMKRYGTKESPNYNLTKIKLPTIMLFRGGNDYLSHLIDQDRLIKELGVEPFMDVLIPDYGHLDFIVGKNITQKVNLPAVEGLIRILKANGTGSFLRNPKPLLEGRKTRKPQLVVEPEGGKSEVVAEQSDTTPNPATGLERSTDIPVRDPSPTTTSTPVPQQRASKNSPFTLQSKWLRNSFVFLRDPMGALGFPAAPGASPLAFRPLVSPVVVEVKPQTVQTNQIFHKVGSMRN